MERVNPSTILTVYQNGRLGIPERPKMLDHNTTRYTVHDVAVAYDTVYTQIWIGFIHYEGS